MVSLVMKKKKKKKKNFQMRTRNKEKQQTAKRCAVQSSVGMNKKRSEIAVFLPGYPQGPILSLNIFLIYHALASLQSLFIRPQNYTTNITLGFFILPSFALVPS